MANRMSQRYVFLGYENIVLLGCQYCSIVATNCKAETNMTVTAMILFRLTVISNRKRICFRNYG